MDGFTSTASMHTDARDPLRAAYTVRAVRGRRRNVALLLQQPRAFPFRTRSGSLLAAYTPVLP